MAFSQLTPLFLDLNMPAILDMLFLIYKRPPTARNLSLQLWPQEPVLLFMPLPGFVLSTCHISPQLQRPACVAAMPNTELCGLRFLIWGLFFSPSNEKKFF